MRFRWLALALIMGIGMAVSPVYAMSNAEYLANRANKSAVPIDDTDQFASLLPPLAGQVIEFEGTVNGICIGSDRPTFLLQLDGSQMAFIMSRVEDPDIAIGNNVRVLAQVPVQGTLLDAIALTQVGADLPSLRGVGVGGDYEADTSIPDFTDLANQYRPGMTVPNPAPTHSTKNDLASARRKVVQLYADQIRRINKNVNEDTAGKIAYHLLEKSAKYDVDPRLTFALVTQESRFNPRAVSYAGAQGLGQLMPRTAAGLGVGNPFDIEQNLDGTIRYLSGQIRRFGLPLALAAYNAGPGNVQRFGGIPPFRETQNYVRNIWKNYCKLAGKDPTEIASR